MESLASSRDLLKISSEKSNAVALKLDRISPKLEEMMARFSSSPKMKFSSPTLKHLIDSAICPFEAVFKVPSTIPQLEKSLCQTTPCSSLPSYLFLVQHLEQSLKFLSDNCTLAILWLQGAAELLEDNGLSDDTHMFNAKLASSRNCRQPVRGPVCLNGGVLNFAFNQLEDEYKRLMTEGSGLCILSEPSEETLGVIIKSLNHSDSLGKCTAIYVVVRSLNAKASFCSFNLSYLDTPHLILEDEEYIVPCDCGVGIWNTP